MTNREIITTIALLVVVIIEWIKNQGWKTNWRVLSAVIGGILGFLWFLCSNISWLNWVLSLVGVQPVNEFWALLILKGVVAGLIATYSYSAIQSVLGTKNRDF